MSPLPDATRYRLDCALKGMKMKNWPIKSSCTIVKEELLRAKKEESRGGREEEDQTHRASRQEEYRLVACGSADSKFLVFQDVSYIDFDSLG
jgi:hypothetical protein